MDGDPKSGQVKRQLWETAAQQDSLRRATDALERNDLKGMVDALLQAGCLDGLKRWLKHKYSDLSESDIEGIIADAVEDLYNSAGKSTRAKNIAAWLVRVCTYKADDLWKSLQREPATADETLRGLVQQEQEQEQADSKAREPFRQQALVLARRLVPKLEVTSYKVMISAYIEAAELGLSDVSAEEICDLAGIKPASFAMTRLRAFKKLGELAAEAGYGTIDFTLLAIESGEDLADEHDE